MYFRTPPIYSMRKLLIRMLIPFYVIQWPEHIVILWALHLSAQYKTQHPKSKTNQALPSPSQVNINGAYAKIDSSAFSSLLKSNLYVLQVLHLKLPVLQYATTLNFFSKTSLSPSFVAFYVKNQALLLFLNNDCRYQNSDT